jgi:hypothetical protein
MVQIWLTRPRQAPAWACLRQVVSSRIPGSLLLDTARGTAIFPRFRPGVVSGRLAMLPPVGAAPKQLIRTNR